jgi:hypothetical protein
MRLGSPAWTRAWGALFALISVFSARSGRADPANISVQVDCGELAEEQRAALESRANAELLVRRQPGTLFVTCRGGRVGIRWQPASGNAVENEIPLPADPRDAEEDVLEALELLLQPAAPPEAAPEQRAPATAPAPPKTPEPPPVAEPAAHPRPVEPAAERGTSPFFEVLAGAAFELWSSEVTGALGPRARVLFAFPGGWALTGGGQIAWALRAPRDVNGRDIRGHLGGEYHIDPGRRFRIGAAAFVELFQAVRDTTSATDSENETVFGAALDARYVLFGAPLGVALGPTVSARTGTVRVAIGADEIFHIPAVTLGFGAELVWGPL